jgi:hypothetical protein
VGRDHRNFQDSQGIISKGKELGGDIVYGIQVWKDRQGFWYGRGTVAVLREKV